MSFLPKIEKLKLLKIWETDKLWQNFYKFKKYKQNPKNVWYKRENRTKTRIVMIGKCRTHIFGVFFGFGRSCWKSFGKPQGNCKKSTKVIKIKILSFLGVKSKFCDYNPPPPRGPFELFKSQRVWSKNLWLVLSKRKKF